MPKKLLIGCGLLVALVAAGAVMVAGGLWLNLKRADRNQESDLDAAVEPVVSAAAKGQPVDQELLLSLAKGLDTRWHLYDALRDINRVELFPKEYAAEPKLAESEMAAWLLHPNEMGALPSDIELTGTVQRSVGGRAGTFYVFKYRLDPPHWAADRGWMAGISGPWPADGQMLTWSEGEPYGEATPEQQVDKLLKVAGQG